MKKFRLLKIIQKIEETMPFKSLFELSRYLDRLPRYKDSKFPILYSREGHERDSVTYENIYKYVFPGIAFYRLSC